MLMAMTKMATGPSCLYPIVIWVIATGWRREGPAALWHLFCSTSFENNSVFRLFWKVRCINFIDVKT